MYTSTSKLYHEFQFLLLKIIICGQFFFHFSAEFQSCYNLSLKYGSNTSFHVLSFLPYPTFNTPSSESPDFASEDQYSKFICNSVPKTLVSFHLHRKYELVDIIFAPSQFVLIRTYNKFYRHKYQRALIGTMVVFQKVLGTIPHFDQYILYLSYLYLFVYMYIFQKKQLLFLEKSRKIELTLFINWSRWNFYAST